MNLRQQKSGEYVTELLAQSPMPRNQIAALSGLSNPYIKDLEEGAFKNVDRDKLIALALALNLTLDKMDELLNKFDRTNLTSDDIPTFIALTKKRALSSAMIPIYDGFPLWHAVLSIEMIPGEYVVVGRHLPSALQEKPYQKYTVNIPGKEHPLNNEITETYRQERRHRFFENLKHFPLHQFICVNCLGSYLKESQSEKELNFRIAHIKNIIATLESYKNYQFRIIPPCHRTYFILKLADGKKEKTDKIAIGFEASHESNKDQRYHFGRLFGFQTSNPSVIHSYKIEVENMKAYELKIYKERSSQIDFLNKMIKEV